MKLGSNIVSRKSTIYYEVMKQQVDKVPQYDITGIDWLQDILKQKYCIYCDTKLANRNKNKGDHLLPIVGNKDNPDLTNFSKLTVPCCAACNSSKGKRSWQDFVKMKGGISFCKNIDTLQKIQDLIDVSIKHYTIDKNEIERINSLIQNNLEIIRSASTEIQIKYITKDV